VTTADTLDCFEAQLSAELESVVAARRLVEAAVKSWGLSERVAADSALAVSELVTNSVLHARTSLAVSIRRMGLGVRLEVSDGDNRLPILDVERAEGLLENRSMTGRGLGLIAATSERWGADPLPQRGKVTWAEVGTGQGLASASGTPTFPAAPSAPEFSPAAAGAGMTAATEMNRDGRQVRLIGVPVRLLNDSTRNLMDLQREMRVMSLDHGVSLGLDELVDVARALSDEIDPWTRMDREILEAALARGDQTVDYELTVPYDAAAQIERLRGWLQRLQSAIVRRNLLTLPPSEEVDAFRNWYSDEVIAQLAGRPPQPCPFDGRTQARAHSFTS